MRLKQFIRGKVFRTYSQYFEKKRKDLFFKYMEPKPGNRVLDLGGNDGSRIAKLFSDGKNEYQIYVADISVTALETAQKKYGFNTVLLDENGKIPFPDDYFDITFCNSVIEHVTVN
ncbi:MAG: class I SAM-dependent methyltransferase, partial [Enterococcus sp.]|nr:class I SAM-dependent methyltransferase [Enterococcus sp.]